MADENVKKEAESESKKSDPELDELLESALQDLTKGVENKESRKDVVAGATAETSTNEWSDEFIKQAAQQFESNMAKIIGAATNQDAASVTPNQIEMNLQKMAEAAAQVVSAPQPTGQSDDFSATITQTLQNLSLGAENLQNPFGDNDFLNMMQGGQEAFLPFMQGMMQSLLSKEVLYPSLKDILSRFPAWLQQNESKLERSEFERYTKQKDLMQQVCDELESENDSEEESVKRQRFDKVLSLMQKMQDLGQPPAEIVGEMGPGVQFDEHGNPVLPEGLNMNGVEQMCCVM